MNYVFFFSGLEGLVHLETSYVQGEIINYHNKFEIKMTPFTTFYVACTLGSYYKFFSQWKQNCSCSTIYNYKYK